MTLDEYFGPMLREKEDTTMQVSYNGFTGELVKLEATYLSPDDKESSPQSTYDLTMYDRGKKVEHYFHDVMLEDVKFVGGTVSFGG